MWNSGKQKHLVIPAKAKLMTAVMKREHPAVKSMSFNAMWTRKQRYSVLASKIIFGSFLASILFSAECFHYPKPALCQNTQQNWLARFFTWGALFASLWGVALSIEIPFILMGLFKKRVVLAQMTEERKRLTTRLWIWKEIAGWVFVFSLHL